MRNIITNLPVDRKHFWINLDEIESGLFPELTDKIEEILIHNEYSYSSKSKEIVRNICELLEIMEYITWKQFDCILNMKSKTKYYRDEIKDYHSESYSDYENMSLGDCIHFPLNFKGLQI